MPRPPPALTAAWLHAVRPLPRTGHPCSAVPSCPAHINPPRRTAAAPYAPAYAHSCAPMPPSACRIPGACPPSPFRLSASPSIAENAACGNGVCSHCLSSRGGENACLRAESASEILLRVPLANPTFRAIITDVETISCALYGAIAPCNHKI